MKQTGFVVSSGRSDFSDAQISDEHVAQVNYQFPFYFFTPFFPTFKPFVLNKAFWFRFSGTFTL